MMYNSFGHILKYLREENHLLQRELAEILHVHKTTIVKWETNKAEPNINMIRTLANYFNVTTDFLLCNEPQKKSNYIKKQDLRDII